MPGRITRRSIDAVRERADIVELVEARTGPARRRAGQVMVRCPFHEERTPSCSLDPSAKLYHCFGCGESGDVFTLVEKLEGLTFEQTVETLADRYGIEVERERVSAAEERALQAERRLEQLLEDVAVFYERYLQAAAEAEAGRAYLRERGIGPDAVARFRLGFAPDAWERVTQAAVAKGYTREELYAAGVAQPGRRGPIDRLRGRLIFPLSDARGRVRGFAGRILPGGEGPKYLNSPESELFRKARLLYGLHLARAAIARRGRAIVVEGYTDVIALHGAGIEEAVASMGTALTEEQVRELRRLAPEVILCFDADAAGDEAAVRGMRRAEAQGLVVRVAALPAGQDPADVATAGRDAFEAVIHGAVGVLAFRIGRVLAAAPTLGLDRAYAAAQHVLADAPATPERVAQVRRVADGLRLDPDSEAALVRGAGGGRAAPAARTSRRLHRDERRERELLAAVLGVPDVGGEILAAGLGEVIRTEAHVALLPWLQARLAGRDDPPPPGLEAVAGEVAARSVGYAVAGAASDDERVDARAAVRELYGRLRLVRIEEAAAVLKGRLASDDYSSEDDRELARLQREAKAIEAALRVGGSQPVPGKD